MDQSFYIVNNYLIKLPQHNKAYGMLLVWCLLVKDLSLQFTSHYNIPCEVIYTYKILHDVNPMLIINVSSQKKRLTDPCPLSVFWFRVGKLNMLRPIICKRDMFPYIKFLVFVQFWNMQPVRKCWDHKFKKNCIWSGCKVTKNTLTYK